MNILIVSGSVLVPLVLLDLLWLGVITRGIYKEQIGHLLSGSVVWWPAVLFYLLFSVGLAVFVVLPSVEASSLMRALLLGALFGLIAYATYDLTNHATMKDWPLMVTLMDMAWGAFMAAIASGFAYWVVTTFVTT